MLSSLLVSAVAQTSSVYTLPIGAPGTMNVRSGQIVESKSGKSTKLSTIVRSAEGVQYVLLGESHDHAEHHQMQAQIIEAFAKSGRDVVVGFEMFDRSNQSNLTNWPLGWGSEEEFIQESNWKAQWGFDFALYRPIFTTVRKYRLPMVALNVPRAWVRSVGKSGFSALTPEQQSELPRDMSLGNRDHRTVFDALMGGHGPTGGSMDNVYSAQVLWDEGMADSAIKALRKRDPAGKPVVIIVAGIGHVMYGQGINYRITRQSGAPTLSVSMVETNSAMTVARGLGDFVYAAKEQVRER
ncbi:MAG: ChaN family lipoprotein [Chthonomonas sp.]|nr:ChaN family lipoprotein [Chthonomonas sp.]